MSKSEYKEKQKGKKAAMPELYSVLDIISGVFLMLSRSRHKDYCGK
jgi:hypothetical protein